MKVFRKLGALAALMASVVTATPAQADVIQLGFILDRSGSIGSTNWTTIVNGLSSAVGTLIPVGGTDTYEVSVVTFGSTASLNIDSYLVSDASARTALAGLIAALPFSGGGTNFGPAFSTMLTALTNGTGVTAANAGASYVNFATDGVEGDPAAGLAARNALIAAGVDNISIEGIGSGVDASGLQNQYCYPGPCDASSPYNFPTQGFYIGVANAQAYADAIGNKIRVVTGGGQVPEPGTAALLGAALLAFAARARRRSKA